jgi:hypothetical protein
MPSTRTSYGALLLALAAVVVGLFVAVDAIAAAPKPDRHFTVYKAKHFAPR